MLKIGFRRPKRGLALRFDTLMANFRLRNVSIAAIFKKRA
jgi:hypothetical protein